METAFPTGSGLIQQDNAQWSTANIVQGYEEHDKKFKVWMWPQEVSDLNVIENLWDVLVRSTEALPHNLEVLMDSLIMPWCQIPQHTFRGFVMSTD